MSSVKKKSKGQERSSLVSCDPISKRAKGEARKFNIQVVKRDGNKKGKEKQRKLSNSPPSFSFKNNIQSPNTPQTHLKKRKIQHTRSSLVPIAQHLKRNDWTISKENEGNKTKRHERKRNQGSSFSRFASMFPISSPSNPNAKAHLQPSKTIRTQQTPPPPPPSAPSPSP